MNRIRVMDSSLANMIAAGEVVERPANVVKELTENSIDAKATRIEIKIKNAGRSYVRVKDNGFGMSAEDASLALLRHATSKIKDKYDLFRIKTLGFRGEALPSIAAVSRLELETSQGDVGVKIVVENNEKISEEKSAARRGTTIEVTKLFYTTPARLKFLRSDAAEYANIVDVVSRQCLAHPDIAFTLLNDTDAIVLQTSGRGDLLEVIKDIYGLEIAKNTIPVEFVSNDFTVSGYIGKFIISKSNRNYIILTVNGRPVKIPAVQANIIEAYSDYIPRGRFPFVVLNIQVDPSVIDVNVHPTKNEIKIDRAGKLKELIRDGVAKVLRDNYMIPDIDNTKKTFVQQPNFDANFTLREPQETPFLTKDDEAPEVKQEEPKTEFSFVSSKKSETPVSMTPIGQIHGSYIVAESPDGFYLIDQHAAMERINYEYYSKKLREGKEKISLLVPVVVEFSLSVINRVKDKLNLLEEIGICIERFGTNALKVSTVPLWMKDVDLETYISDIVEQIANDKKLDAYALKDYAIKTIACKASLKANAHLSLDEMNYLIRRLLACDNPHNCAHGRPTMIFYSNYELEKMFMRTM